MGRIAGVLKVAGIVCLVLASTSAGMATDVAKKFRLGLAVGAFEGTDSVESDAANVLLTRRPDFEVDDIYFDPRDDGEVFGQLELKSSPLATLSFQYAFTSIFVLEGSAGYQKGDIGDVELAAEFSLIEIPLNFQARYTHFRVPVGELERVPLKVTAIARLRPRARFNPYFGVGIGYSFIGFEPSDELNQLSVNLDRAFGVQARLDPIQAGGGTTPITGAPSVDLLGAEVTANDSFEWHAVVGAEIGFKAKGAFFVDLRWVDASREFEIGFNGSSALGFGVPNNDVFQSSATGQAIYGPMNIPSGGLIDAGSVVIVPADGQPLNTECNEFQVEIGICIPRFQLGLLDGQPDPGDYYIQGGKVSYDGYSVQLGYRFTF